MRLLLLRSKHPQLNPYPSRKTLASTLFEFSQLQLLWIPPATSLHLPASDRKPYPIFLPMYPIAGRGMFIPCFRASVVL